MIKSLEIEFIEDKEAKNLHLDFDFSNTNTMYLEQTSEELQEEPWVQLEYYKCKQCTLSKDNYRHCPAALSLGKYAKELFHRHSTDRVSVHVKEDNGRELRLNSVPLQEVTGELVKLAVFQSECPIGRRIKKALQFVPAFPNDKEISKAFALFFAMQQLKKGMDGKSEVEKEQELYLESLHELFENLCYRVRHITRGDASVNGVMIYHSLMMLVSLSLPEVLEKVIDEYSSW